ncbi:MAG: hypothetical protein RL189_3064 [Pseudomonadota bacterium]|jgi:hypothetical protein
MRIISGLSFGLFAVLLASACSKAKTTEPVASEAGKTDSVQGQTKADDAKPSETGAKTQTEPEAPQVVQYSLSKNVADVSYCQDFEIKGSHTVPELDSLLNSSPAVSPRQAQIQPVAEPLTPSAQAASNLSLDYSSDFGLEKKKEGCSDKAIKPAGGYCAWTVKKDLSGGSATILSKQSVFWTDIGLLLQVGQSELLLSSYKKQLDSVRATIKVSEENIATMRMQLNAIEGLPDSEDQSLVLEEQIETAEEVLDGLKAEELAKDQSIVILESTLTQQKNAVKVAQDALKVACNVSELGVTTAEWVEL